MSKPDLDTVSARRAALVRELSDLERTRAELEAEDVDLIVAERVLKRLAEGAPHLVHSGSPTPISAPRVRSAPVESAAAPRTDGPILES